MSIFNRDNKTTRALLSSAAFSGAALSSENAEAELVNVFMSATVTNSASPNFNETEALEINLTIDTDTPPLFGDPATLLSHPDALAAFEFFSGNYSINTVPELNSIEVRNEMNAASETGDLVDLVIGGGNLPFQGLLKLGFTFPNPGGNDPTLSSANLHDAVLALPNFTEREFSIIDQSNSVSGRIDSLTIAPPTGLTGDFDRNGIVNGQDLAIWQQEFGKSGIVKADADGDRNVDGHDFLIWQRNYGNEALTAQTSVQVLDGVNNTQSTPEPSGLTLLVSASVLAAGFLGRYLKKGQKEGET